MGACSRTMSSTNRAPTKPFGGVWVRAGAGASGGRAAPGVVRLLPPPTSDASADAGTPLLGPLAVAVGAATADDVGADPREKYLRESGGARDISSESCDARARATYARMPAGRFVADAEPGGSRADVASPTAGRFVAGAEPGEVARSPSRRRR